MIELLLAASVGFLFAIVVMVICQDRFYRRQKEAEIEAERNDPANWWKYGGDPFSSAEDE